MSNKNPLTALLDPPIAFHRVYVTLTGSVKAALMLSQAVYWENTTDDPEGWFYKSRDEWNAETGMERAEQEGARAILRAFPFWGEKLAGSPATVHYRVDCDALIESLKTLRQPSLVGAKQAISKPANRLAQNKPSERRKTCQPKGAKQANPIRNRDYTETTAESVWQDLPENTHTQAPSSTPKAGPIGAPKDAPTDPASQLATLFLRGWEYRYHLPPTTNHGYLQSKFREVLARGIGEAQCRAVIEFYLKETTDTFWAEQAHSPQTMFSQWDRIAVWVASGKPARRSRPGGAPPPLRDYVAETEQQLLDLVENGDELTRMQRGMKTVSPIVTSGGKP